MTNTLAQVEAFGPAHPHPHQGGTWNQRCEQFINNSGGFSQAFGTAQLAGNASGFLDPDPTTARPGEIHYWSDLAGEGHDAWQTTKGLLCASNVFANFWGYISFASFTAKKPAFHYRGHTFRHGTQTLTGLGTTTSGTGSVTPINERAGYQGRKMQLVYNTLGDGHYLAQLLAEEGTIVDQIDNQAGYNGGAPSATVANPVYVIYQQIFDPRAAVFNPVLTAAQNTILLARIKSNWVKPAVGGTTSLQSVLDAIAGISKLETTDQTALITALNALPAAVRTKIIAP